MESKLKTFSIAKQKKYEQLTREKNSSTRQFFFPLSFFFFFPLTLEQPKDYSNSPVAVVAGTGRPPTKWPRPGGRRHDCPDGSSTAARPTR